jgi:hypothetical protein
MRWDYRVAAVGCEASDVAVDLVDVRHEAAAILRRVVAAVDRDELHAPAWFVERLRGAVIALEADR